MDLQLVITKYAYKPEHLTDWEEQVWLKYLRDEGFSVSDPKEFFEMFGSSDDSMREFSTDELRIRYWKWFDTEGLDHSLMEMNYFPGDAEMGIILIDGVEALTIDNVELTWIGKPLDGFDKDLFAAIRTCLAEDDIEELDSDVEYYDRLIEYFRSEDGQDACAMEKAVSEKYQTEINQIYEQMDIDNSPIQTLDLIESWTPPPRQASPSISTLWPPIPSRAPKKSF
jgi:hypothetical protein